MRQPWRNAGQRMHCFRVNTWYRSENPRAVCVFVSPVLMIIPSSTNRQVDHFHPTWYLSHLPAGIFYCMPLKKNATKFFVFEAKLFGRLHWHTINFVSFKKRPNSSLYVQYSRTLIWFFKDFKFAYKTTKFYTKWLVHNFGQKHKLQYLEKFAV